MLQKVLEHPSNAMRSSGVPAIDLSKAEMRVLIPFVRLLRYNR